MHCRLQQSESQVVLQRKRIIASLLMLVILIGSSGCSMFVMAGKAIFGNPKVTSPFTAATGEKLSESEESIVIICSAPHRVLAEFASIQIDIVDRVSRDLETQGIKVVPAGDVGTWFDDHGEWGDYSELATAFDAGYVLHVELRSLNYRVPESENLMQGRAEGHLSMYKVSGGKKSTLLTSADTNHAVTARSVFDRDFKVEFPTSYPVPRESRSEDQFLQEFLDRVALHLSQHLYDYHMSESIH